jgi:hypothetical protein
VYDQQMRGVLLAALVVVALLAGSARSSGDPLARPLHLPHVAKGAACPVSRIDRSVDWKRARIFGGFGYGPGPVYPGLGTRAVVDVWRDEQYGGPWYGQKVFWYVLPTYRGPVLIRSRRLDGPEWMRFDAGRLPAAQLRIDPNETVSWEGMPEGSRGRPSGVRARAQGCYGVQIDGTTFSRVVVFKVTLTP